MIYNEKGNYFGRSQPIVISVEDDHRGSDAAQIIRRGSRLTVLYHILLGSPVHSLVPHIFLNVVKCCIQNYWIEIINLILFKITRNEFLHVVNDCVG